MKNKAILIAVSMALIASPRAFASQTDLVAVQTIYLEARGESKEGQVAVGEVIRNRVAIGGWWGNSVKKVCLRDYQFSCWNNLPEAERSLRNAWDREMQESARSWEISRKTNLVRGATHYCRYDSWPAWRSHMKFIRRIGNHLFFKERNR